MPSIAPPVTPIEENYNLPASWYRSSEIYELERRAIFSKQWLFTTHQSRIKETGQYVLFQVAGYAFFLLRDREGTLRAFHNVCRHRAFPVIGSKKEGEVTPTTEAGKVSVLACKYHNWSYSMKGTLAKAPGFDEVPSFKPSENSLFDLRVHVDRLGFVWVNMDKSETAISWEEQCGSWDKQDRVKDVEFERDYEYSHSWSMEDCQYNWKVLCDNFNECYHCGSSHPGIAKATDLKNYHVKACDNYIAHYATPKPGYNSGHRQGGDIIPVFTWPFSAITICPGYAYSMRVVPTGPTTTAMQYDVYRHKNTTDVVFEEINAAFMQIESEDKFLCTNVQKNMRAGTYNTGALHPQREAGVIYFQSLVRKALLAHRELEQAAGHPIYPAKFQQRGETQEDKFCAELEGAACGGEDKRLAW